MCHQYLVRDHRLINEQKRETPEWTESIIPVSPIMRLEHCQIATLTGLGYYSRMKDIEEKLTREQQ